MQGTFATVIIGLLLIVFGILFLLDQTGAIDFEFWDLIGDLWPVALIILGIWIIYNQARGGKSDSEGVFLISSKKVFGSIDVSPESIDSKGLDYSVTFGDIHIYLTRTELMSGENKINTSVGFGDIHLVIREDIPCKVSGNCSIGDIRIFGEESSGIPAKKEHIDNNYDSAEKKLRITAKCGAGDIRIKRT